MAKLPRHHQRLVREIEAIIDRASLDLNVIREFQDDEARYIYLVRLRAVLVRGVIVDLYAMFDEMLGSEMAAYFFRGVNFPRMWRKDKFKLFNYVVLEKLSTRNKLDLVKAILKMPRGIAGKLEAIIALRNEIAHSLFPENLRAHRGRRMKAIAPMACPYRGEDVFTANGLGLLLDDAEEVRWYLRNHGTVYGHRQRRDDKRAITFV